MTAGAAPAESTGRSGSTGPDPTTAGLTYEQARDELADVVRRLEAGGVPLEESLALWERGEQLAELCGRLLEGARERLERRADGDG